MSSLQGKVAIVTGGAQGIGAAIVRRFAADGAEVYIADIAGEAGRQLAATSPKIHFIECNVGVELDVQNCLHQVDQEQHHIDIIVNDAAWQLNKPLLDTTTAEFEQVLNINLTGTFRFLKWGAQYMIDHQIKGAFVNFSSTFAIVGSPGYLAYHASKGAISSLTRAAAISLIPYGIKVNAVAPGTTDTPGLHDGARDTGDEQKGLASFKKLQPLGRFGQPEEIANVVRFLADDDSNYVCGATLVADGGYTIV